MTDAPQTTPYFYRPTDIDLLWLCAHPDHALCMVEIEGEFCPMLVDKNGNGPILPTEEEGNG